MHCPNCGQKILEGSDFCSNCGAPVVRQLVGPTCAKCGSRNLPEAEFCAECGARLGGESVPMQSFCPECGAAVKESATFCKMCGAKLKEAAAPVQSVCPGCGEPLAPDAVFCGNCGRPTGQGAEYLPAAPELAATEDRPSYQSQKREQAQDQQQDWMQPQAQNWEPVQTQPQGWAQQQPQTKSQPKGSRKMMMAAAAAVVLLVIGITGFWKPGFLLNLFHPTAKLENGMLSLNDISLDFKQTNLKNGEATLTTVKDKEEEVQNGLIGDLYVMNIDKNCQGKVTVSVPAPKDFKPTTGNGVYIKLGIGRDYVLENGGKTRFYDYFDATVKDGRAVAVIDPAALGRSQRKSKAAAKPAVKTPDVGQFTEYVGVFFKNGIIQYGEGYQNTKGHFRLWYNYNVQRYKNVYMAGGDAQNLLSDLEEAYNYYKTHGYADHVDTYVPIDVYITRCKDEGGWQTLTGNMELKEASIFGVDLNQGYEGDNRKNTRTTIYHEFFHAVQQSIIGTAASASDSKNSNWFDEATATHFERLIVPDAVSENGRKNFWLLWQGTIPQKSGTADGYARGLLIDYMSKKLGGNDWIRDCYNRWSADYSKLKSYMKQIAATDADFAANFYMEVVKNSGPQSVSGYYVTSQIPNKSMGEDTYLSAINLALDDKAKEKLSNGEDDAFPIVFTSPSFVLEGYGGHVISLVSHKRVGATVENLTENFPEKCQLKLEADGGCRIQVIKFKGNADVKSSNNTIINDFKGQINKGYKYLVLVTSAQPAKQNVVLKATLEKEELKEGIYNGKATMTQGKKTGTRNNVLGFRLSQGKDGKWGLNVCQANGDYASAAANVPLTYDAKQKIWKGHRKFKENVSKNPNMKKEEVVTIDCTMKVNTEGKEPVLIVTYNADGTTWKWGYPTREAYNIKFEGKWTSELKGKNLSAGKEGKITILE